MPNARLSRSADSVPDYDTRLLPSTSDDSDGPSPGPRQDVPGMEMEERGWNVVLTPLRPGTWGGDVNAGLAANVRGLTSTFDFDAPPQPRSAGAGINFAGGGPTVREFSRDDDDVRMPSFLASAGSKPRLSAPLPAVDLWGEMNVSMDGSLFEVESGVADYADKMVEHLFELKGVRSAADLRKAVDAEIKVNLPENEKYRVVSLKYAPDSNTADPGDDDLHDMAELEDDDIAGLAGPALRIEVRIGLQSRLLMSSDMLEHDEGKELFERNVGDDNYKLTVHVARGKDLRGMSRNGTSDPFVQCELCREVEGEGDEVADGYELVDFLPASTKKRSTRRTRKATQARYRKQTSVIKRNNVNPEWEEDLSFDIPAAACSREQLAESVLRIKCFSADSVLNTEVKRTSKEHLIGSTYINMFDVLETIGSVDDHQDDNDDPDGKERAASSDWYCLMDKKITATRKARLSTGANQAMKKVGSRFKRHAEPTAEEPVEDLTEDEEEEEKTGDLQLSFSLVEPEGNEDENPIAMEPASVSQRETWQPEAAHPEFWPEPEPEPFPDPEPTTSPYCDGKIEVEVVRCAQILAPHKKQPANVCVKMALYGSSPYAHRQTKSTGYVQCAKNDLDPFFGGMHMQELDIYQKEQKHELVLQLLHKKQDRSGQIEVLGQTVVDLRENFEQAETSFGRWDEKIGTELRLDGQFATKDVYKVKGNSQKISAGECGTIEVKLTFKPCRTVGASFQDLRKTVQLSERVSRTPKRDEKIQRLFRGSFHTPAEPASPSLQQAVSSVSFSTPGQTTKALERVSECGAKQIEARAGGDSNVESSLQFKNCKVEILMLGARELVRKPRKPMIVCEYLCEAAEAPKQSFRITDGGQLNPTFTAARSDLERKSPSKLRKMIQESQQTGVFRQESLTVLPKDTKKDDLVQKMLEVPHLTVQNCPYRNSKQTKVKISVYEQPFRGPPKEFGSATVKLYCPDGVDDSSSGAPQDEETVQLWKDACDSYIEGVRTLCESTRDAREVKKRQVDMWWKRRLDFNQKEAEETLTRAMLLWWTIHSEDGKVKIEKVLENTWEKLGWKKLPRVQPSENTWKELLKQIFCIVPDQDTSVRHIINTHMDLKRRSSQTAGNDRRIYRHDVQKWWQRNSIRSTHIFESAWKKTVTGTDSITAGQFGQFLIRLLDPSAEEKRTAFALFTKSTEFITIKDWWEQRLTCLASESSRPKGNSELRSLLLDENRLSTHFGQQADAAGPSETESLLDAEDQEQQNALGGLGNWIGAGGLDAEDGGNDIRIDVAVDEPARASRFDPFLAQWRQIYDKFDKLVAIPDIEGEWKEAWKSKNSRMTMSTLSLDDTAPYTRENFVEVLQQVLKLDDSIAEKLFDDLDNDSSGEVDKYEAQEWFERHARQGGQLRFDLAWSQADRDCSNELNFMKFKAFIQVLLCPTDSDVDKILDEISQVEGTTEANDVLRIKPDESQIAFENRCRAWRNEKRRELKEAKGKRDKKVTEALTLFKAAKDNLDRIGSFQGLDEQQLLLDLVSNVDAAISRAENGQEAFSRVVLADWEKGRRYLPTTWERSCKGGMVPFFPRYLLSVEQEVVQVEGDTTMTEGETTDYETDGEITVPRVNVGAIRCAFRVSLPEVSAAETDLQEAETRRWREVKALMSPQRVVVRVYVIEGTGLRAMHGNSSSTYLQCSLGKQTVDTKDRCISTSLNPEWREKFEFDTVLPGPAVVRLQVKHRSSFSKDKDIGVTEIDLERRYYCDQWRRRKLSPIETRDLNANGLKQLAKSFGNTGHGSVKLWVDIHQQHDGVPIPPAVDIRRAPTEHFQLRLIIWNTEGIPLQGSNKALKCHNMSFSAHMRTTGGGNVHEVKKETDTHWRAKEGRANFNHRMVFDFEVDARLPVQQPSLLTLKCWDKEPLRLTNKLIGYKEINISDLLEKALQERLDFMKRRQIIDEQVEIGNVQELQRLLNRFKDQNATADEERDDQDKADKIKRSKLATGIKAPVDEDDEYAEEDMLATDTDSSDDGKMCALCCGAKTKNLASVIGQLNEDQTEVDVLQATHEYRKNNVRCFHLNMMSDAQPGADMPRPRGTVWASIELMHKSLADERKAGDGRSEPNEHPILEEPVREKIGIRNVMGSLSVLVGAKNVKLAKLLIGVMLLVMVAMEIVPQVTSAFVMQALRKGLPLPCNAGFQKASNAYHDACGAH